MSMFFHSFTTPDSCADPVGVDRGLDLPEISQKYMVSKQYWSGSPEKPRQHSRLDHHRPPAKRH